MSMAEFRKSLSGEQPPAAADVYLQSLWYDAKGDWEKAHQIVQDISGAKAAGIHAYLHRKEGDLWNADYWYRRSDRQRPSASLDREWEDLVTGFLEGVNR